MRAVVVFVCCFPRALALLVFQVGSYYKSPRFPVWVVGSTSHFSVLFSRDAASNEQSPSAGALQAFSKFDEHSNKFVDAMHLPAILADLGLPIAGRPAEVAALQSRIGGTGIILCVPACVCHAHRWPSAVPFGHGNPNGPIFVACLLTISSPAAHPSNVCPSYCIAGPVGVQVDGLLVGCEAHDCAALRAPCHHIR